MIKLNSKFIYTAKNHIILHENDFYEWFIAKNNLGNYFVASLIEEDEENGYLIYLYNFVSNDNLVLFLTQKISYKQLIERSDEIFLVKQRYNYEIFNTEKISTKSEKMHWPHHSLFAPERKYKEMSLFLPLLVANEIPIANLSNKYLKKNDYLVYNPNTEIKTNSKKIEYYAH